MTPSTVWALMCPGQFAQAATGMQARYGAGGAPQLQRLAVTDYGTGYLGAYAVALALLISRPVPVVAEAVVFLAGAAGFPVGRFLLAIVPANAALATVWAGLGAASSHGNLTPALAGAIMLPALAWALWHWFRRA